MRRSLKLGLPICGFLVLSACDSPTQAKPDPFGYRQLTTDGGKTESPSLSPDGKFVVYSSDRASHGNSDIWVQDVAQGISVRVTDDPASDYDPVFSADGKTVYFTSLREPQGIYRVAASGGEAELVARGATSPQVSPGGEELLFSDASGHLAVLQLADHSMRELPEDFFNSYAPKWSPDGKEILFTGKAAQGDELEWWVMSLAGGTPVKTGLVSALRQGGFSDVFAQAWLPGDGIVFAGKRGDQITLWRVQLTPDRRGMADQPVRATNDDSGDFKASYAAGRLVFERSKGSPNLWSLPVDVNQARVTGELTRLTSTEAQKGSAFVSADGQKLLYSENQGGTFRLVYKDLAKGKESIVGPAENSFYGVLSADGSRYWFSEGPAGAIDVFARSIKGWRSWWSHSVCALCGMPRTLSRDGKSLLTWSDAENHVDLVDLETGKSRRVLENSSDHFYGPELSPQGGWISFVAGTGKDNFRTYIAPVRGDRSASEFEWVPVGPASNGFQMAFWSPDESILYLLSPHVNQHGEGNLTWLGAQRLDPDTKHPIGELLSVYHFKDARVPGMDPIWNHPAAVEGRIVLELVDSSTNVWIMNAAAAPQ